MIDDSTGGEGKRDIRELGGRERRFYSASETSSSLLLYITGKIKSPSSVLRYSPTSLIQTID
jgi:hypothetical protein